MPADRVIIDVPDEDGVFLDCVGSFDIESTPQSGTYRLILTREQAADLLDSIESVLYPDPVTEDDDDSYADDYGELTGTFDDEG